MNQKELIPHLFRSEFSKIVAVLCKTYGLSSIELAEDLVGDTFLVATETWGRKGNPDNPRAWLYQVAKNKAKDHFKREKIFTEKIKPELKNKIQGNDTPEIDLSESNIKDSQLQMMFAVCNPIIPVDGQIALALRILCGFGIDEIAQAFLSNKSTINKRLHRTKQKLKTNQVDLSFPEKEELEDRLSNVLSIIYLLFNEGYYSTTSVKTIRKDLCYEAMRLLYMLINNESTNKSECNALMALFCFHTSRFDARVNDEGENILYEDQNQDEWNDELIEKGESFLQRAAIGKVVTKYHLEAAIAFWHSRKNDQDQKWENVLQLYNRLLQTEYSPMAALNRTYALSKARGKEIAIKEALKINLESNYMYHALLGDLYAGFDNSKQIEHLKMAIKLTTNPNDKKVFVDKLEKLDANE